MKYVFKVEGLMCEKCVARLTNVLTADETVQDAVVSLAENTAVVTTDADADSIKNLIEDAGFDAALAE